MATVGPDSGYLYEFNLYDNLIYTTNLEWLKYKNIKKLVDI